MSEQTKQWLRHVSGFGSEVEVIRRHKLEGERADHTTRERCRRTREALQRAIEGAAKRIAASPNDEQALEILQCARELLSELDAKHRDTM